MGKITVNKPSLFIMTEDGKPMPLGETINVETIEEHSKDNHDEIILIRKLLLNCFLQ